MVAWQKIALGRHHAGKSVPVAVIDTNLPVDVDGDQQTVRRTTDRPAVQVGRAGIGLVGAIWWIPEAGRSTGADRRRQHAEESAW
jgi:hypothetical protein